MNHWEKLHSEEAEGFSIVLSITHEDIDPRSLFDEDHNDLEQIYKDINNGTLVWFCARVQVFKHGIELASDYIGGNLYEDPKEFITDGMYEDLKDQAITDAKANIKKLTEEATQ